MLFIFYTNDFNRNRVIPYVFLCYSLNSTLTLSQGMNRFLILSYFYVYTL